MRIQAQSALVLTSASGPLESSLSRTSVGTPNSVAPYIGYNETPAFTNLFPFASDSGPAQEPCGSEELINRHVFSGLAAHKEDKGLEKLDDLGVLGPYLNKRCSASNLKLATGAIRETDFDNGRNHGDHIAFREFGDFDDVLRRRDDGWGRMLWRVHAVVLSRYEGRV